MKAVDLAPRAPRVTPLEPPFEAEIGALLQKLTPPNSPNVLALFRVLAVNPRLTERMGALGGYLLGRSASISLRDREIVIDRICALAGAEYEWGVHVAAFAAAAQLAREEISAITRVPARLESLPERDKLLVRLADEVHETANISDALWGELAATWTPPQLLELILLAGWYRAIAGICNAARVPLESWQARFAEYS